MGSLPLAMAATKVNDLCSEGDVVTAVFIKYAQQSKMVVSHQNINRVIVNYSKIGKSWKYDGSQSNKKSV